MILHINNIKTYIDQATPDEIEQLISLATISISYFSKTKWAKRPTVKVSRVCYMNRNDLSIPTGLLPRIMPYFDNIKYIDYRHKPNKTLDLLLNLPQATKLADYSFQEDIVDAAVKYERGLIISPTGSGKTIVMAKLIQRLGVETVVIVPNLLLLNQTYKHFKTIFGGEYVGRVGGGEHNWEAPIVIATQQSTYIRLKKNIDNFERLFFSKQMLLLDECHHVGLDSKRVKEGNQWVTKENAGNAWFKVASAINTYYRFGFSATIGTDSVNSQFVLEAATGQVIYKVGISDLIDRKVLCPIITTMIKIKHDTYTSWRDVKDKDGNIKELGAYENSIINCSLRNDIIVKLAKKLVIENKKVLILVDLVEKHGKLLAEAIPNSIFLWGADSAKVRDEGVNKFIKSDDSVLIGTIFGEGFDLPAIDALIIATGGKNKKNVMQQIGRVLRVKDGKTEAEVYDFFDDDGANHMCWKHSMSRKKVYQSEEKYRLVEVNDDEIH